MKGFPGLLCLVCRPLSFWSPGWAYEEERARANFATELAECAAYFTLATEGARRARNDEAVAASEAAALAAMMAASQYSEQDVTLARVQLSLKEQASAIHHDFANLAILILKYGELCKEAMAHPDKRLMYWRNRK